MKPAFALALFALLATSVFAQTTESKSKQESRQIIGAGSGASDIEQSKDSLAPQQQVPESPQQIQLRPSAMSSGDLPARIPSGASVDDANAQMRSEIEQLKLLVQRQEARIAALEQQQPAVRRNDHDSESNDLLSLAEATSSVAPPVSGGTQAAPQVASLQTPQNAGSSDERIRNLERRMQGLGPISISGDIRVRSEPWFNGPPDGSLDRARARIRARLNFFADLGEQFQTGLSLASGEVYDPITTNSTLGVFYTRKAFELDQAFITYKPREFKPLTLTAGKFRYPWYNTELTWDKDLNPEGAAETFAFPLENVPVLKRVAIVAFQLPFAEVAYNSPTAKNIVQSMTYGVQLQTTWQLMSHLSLSAYTGYYDFQNADPIAVALAKASAKNPQTPWAGSLPLNAGGNVSQNSITTTASANIVTINGKKYPTGVTSVTNAQFGSKFGLFDSVARLDWDTGNTKLPVTFVGDYVQNMRACANVGHILPAPSNTASLVYAQTTNFPCKSDQRRGYWLEGRIGRLVEKRDWQLGYTRIYIQREAVLSNFDYSEMLQGTNVTEHRFDAFYMFQKSVQLGFTALIGKPLGVQGQKQPWLERLQFDAIYIF
jgi:hypothetical protein